MISMSASMILVPTATAAPPHNPGWDIVTFAHVAALPEEIGVDQTITIYAWLDKVFDGAAPIGSASPNTYRFHNFTLTIQKPDNTTETLYQDYIADTTSNQAFSYTPTMEGTYKVVFTFPGQRVNAFDYNPTSAAANDTYLPSSATNTFTVTAEPVRSVIDTYPLPTEYWTRPIYGENSIWYLISSNWLGAGSPGYGGFANTYNMGGNGELFPADAVGPMTGHIMWTSPLQSGGVVGGDNYAIKGNTYFEGSAYIQRYMNPIIVNGKIYYSEPLSYGTGNGYMEKCVDLRTGETIWENTMPQPSFAYIYDVEDYNQHGVGNAFLVATSGGASFFGPPAPQVWRFYDADTGVFIFNATNVPVANAFQKAMGPNGEILEYIMTNQGTSTNANYTLGQWNSSKIWSYTGNTPSFSNNADVSGNSRYDWMTTIPWRNNMTSVTVVSCIYDDIMLCYNGSLPSTGSTFMGTLGFNPYTYFAVNLNASKGHVGDILWMKTVNPPAGNVTVLEAGVDPVNRVFVENLRESINFRGFALDTGEYLWTSEPQAQMDYYGSPASGSISNTFAYGHMYSSAYAGIVYCYDTCTGDIVWTYGNGGEGNSTQGYMDVPGHYPTFINAIGNGVVYTVTSEHTIETPLFKGALARGINATDGSEIWTLNSYTGEFMGNSFAMADGYATWFNGLDNQIYSVGRGPSSLTVSAPQAAIAQGQSLVISGTVMDVSAGAQQNEQAARFANGVPVASDASMKDWMGYVYQQKPLPTNFTGVEVQIAVTDANGNTRTVGTTTTDETGHYSFQWTPDITGMYKVTAIFAGSNGYWPSVSTAGFAVDAAAATPTPMPTQPPSSADLYFVPAIAGLFVAIIVVGLLTIVLLRKK